MVEKLTSSDAVLYYTRFLNPDGTHQDMADERYEEPSKDLLSRDPIAYLAELEKRESKATHVDQANGREYIRYFKQGDIAYTIVQLGGFGWSRGLGSTVQVLDGPEKGKLYNADIGQGITIKGPRATSRRQ